MTFDLGYLVQLPEEVHLLVYVGLLLLLSQLGGKVARWIHAPRVTGYLIAGIVFGPSLLGLWNKGLIENELAVMVDVALGVIAFSVGSSLHWSKVRRLGGVIFWTCSAQAVGAVVAVSVALAVALRFSSLGGEAAWGEVLAICLLVGAMSAATAPAAVLSIVHECRARGPLTTVLLGVVALDDAFTIIFYAIAVVVAQGLLSGAVASEGGATVALLASVPVSLAIGLAAGLLLRLLTRVMRSADTLLAITLGTLLLTSGVAITMGASPLLANMTLGFFVANFIRHHGGALRAVESIEEPLFGLFFAMAGAHLDFAVLSASVWLAWVLVVARFAGKLAGTVIGATASGAPPAVRKYLGLGLLPKAGVTIGLLLEAKATLGDGDLVNMVIAAVLGSVILNELVTPFGVRFALKKAGETQMA
jgi:Kef-type K+ transport system membrane component KefB